jgi:trafficking protein particle complex subunit 6
MASRDSLQIPRGPLTASSSSLNLAVLADPPARTMDGAAFDYFMIELVNTVRASSQVAVARAKAIEQEMVEAGLVPPPAPAPKKAAERESTGTLASTASRAAATKAIPDEEEPVRKRLEAIGQHVGANITERYALIIFFYLPIITLRIPVI